MTEKMYRLAISNSNSTCYNCAEEGLPEGVDYCGFCRYVYSGETDFRTDYADHTVGWYETAEEAEAAEKALVPTH